MTPLARHIKPPVNPMEPTAVEKALLLTGKRIEAIKSIRTRTRCKLGEAKAATDPLWDVYLKEHPER